MSYILDALKKAEQGRNSGKVPALFSVQIDESISPRKPMWPWVIGIALLLNGVVLLFWMQRKPVESPGNVYASTQLTPSAPTPRTLSTASESSSIKPALPSVDAPHTAAMTTPKEEIKERTVDGLVREVELKKLPASAALSPGLQRSEPTKSDRPLAFKDLPAAIQQEIPQLVVQLHMYSERASNRLANINNRPLREGDELSQGLRLIEIMPDGFVFSYKGYRFKKGII